MQTDIDTQSDETCRLKNESKNENKSNRTEKKTNQKQRWRTRNTKDILRS